jgi:hypothetical protein
LSLTKDQPGAKHWRENMVDTWKTLSPQFKRYLTTTSIFSLAYFSFALLLLRGHKVGFAFATMKRQVIVLFVIYGVFHSIDEAQSKAFIADIELERRASAIGVNNFVTGIVYLPAPLIAGALWLVNPASAFILAACISFFAIVAFFIVRPDLHRVSGVFPG